MARISLVEHYDNRDIISQMCKCEDTSRNAEATANASDGKAQDALDKSTEAVVTANSASDVANGIAGMAEEALDKSTDAIITATEANNDANTAGSKAQLALDTAKDAEATANGIDDKVVLAMAHADESMAKVNAILSSPVTIVGPITTANPITYNPTDPVTSGGTFQNLLRVHNPDIKNFIFAYCNYATTQNIFSLSLATPNGTQIRLELRAFEDDSAVLYLQNDKTGAKKDIVKLEAPDSSPSMLSMSSTFNDPSHSRVMDDAPVRYNY